MISWFKYPFIRLLIPFAIGIYLAFALDNMANDAKIILRLLILLSLLLLSQVLTSSLLKDYCYRRIFSSLLYLYLIVLGFTLVKIKEYKLCINDISSVDLCPKYYYAILVEPPIVKEKSIKVMMKVFGIEDDNGYNHDVNAKVVSYFEINDKSLGLRYGDCIVFMTNPEQVEKPPNPEQFDYKDYIYKKGVTHQVYLKSDAWLDIAYNDSNPIYRFSYWLRDFLLETMQELGVHGEEYSVAAAILLGYDDSLPQELRQKYVAAGAMHILCVSGLHVGVIFMVFSYMLAFLDNRKKWQYVMKNCVLFVLIWFYALIAGLAPSILRATIMLSFVIVGNMINRKGVLLNSLAASAFILLCVNPANLFDVGFQLSYVAVIGIVVLQVPISKVIYSKYKIVNKIWEITSVTIAAQIATAPFTIYYFHQFPIYFWLSNLFMTPISSVVIMGGMIMLLIFFIPYVNVAVAWIVSKMIYIMNFGVSWIESLPYSIIKGLYVNDIQFVVLLIILLLLLLLIECKDIKMLLSIMIMSCIFLIVNVDINLKRHKQKELVIYSINNMTAIDFINGGEHLILSDSIFINDKSAFSYNIENFLVKKGLYHAGKNKLLHEDFDENFVKKRKNVVTFDEKLIGLSDGSVFSREELSYKIPLDYMLIYGRKRQTLSYLLNVYNFDYLIVDGSVPYYLTSRLIDEADALGIKYHNIREDGAFLMK